MASGELLRNTRFPSNVMVWFSYHVKLIVIVFGTAVQHIIPLYVRHMCLPLVVAESIYLKITIKEH